jgi:hydroxypyruvate isomerase
VSMPETGHICGGEKVTLCLEHQQPRQCAYERALGYWRSRDFAELIKRVGSPNFALFDIYHVAIMDGT